LRVGAFFQDFLRAFVIVPEIRFSDFQVKIFDFLQVFIEVKDTPLED